MKNTFRGSHLPQHIHMQPAPAAGRLMSNSRLRDATLDCIGDQLLVALTSRSTAINDGNESSVFIIGIGIDPGKRSDAVGCRPCPRTVTIGDGDALSPFDEGMHLAAGNDDGV